MTWTCVGRRGVMRVWNGRSDRASMALLGLWSLDSDGAGGAVRGWEPALKEKVLEKLSLAAPWAVWGSRSSVTWRSHTAGSARLPFSLMCAP